MLDGCLKTLAFGRQTAGCWQLGGVRLRAPPYPARTLVVRGPGLPAGLSCRQIHPLGLRHAVCRVKHGGGVDQESILHLHGCGVRSCLLPPRCGCMPVSTCLRIGGIYGVRHASTQGRGGKEGKWQGLTPCGDRSDPSDPSDPMQVCGPRFHATCSGKSCGIHCQACA